MTAHHLALLVVLGLLWLALSGHFTPLLLGLGTASVLGLTLLARRMDRIDAEPAEVPLHLTRLPGYWLWLAKEIVLANLDVARRILDPRLPIDPVVVRVRATQRSDAGRVVFANSITLTPGTVSLEVGPDFVDVHALTGSAAAALEDGEMDRRVSALERPAAGERSG